MEGKEARVGESRDRVERVRTCRLVFARLGFGVASVCGGMSGAVVEVVDMRVVGPGSGGLE
jgi:hypothetical protein